MDESYVEPPFIKTDNIYRRNFIQPRK